MIWAEWCVPLPGVFEPVDLEQVLSELFSVFDLVGILGHWFTRGA